MSVFTAELTNQPGELARLTEALASAGVNMMLSGAIVGEMGAVVFTVDDENATRGALQTAGIEVRESPALQLRLSNRPGTGATIARRLADADVNVTAFLPILVSGDEAIAVIAVDDIDKARGLLGDVLVS